MFGILYVKGVKVLDLGLNIKTQTLLIVRALIHIDVVKCHPSLTKKWRVNPTSHGLSE